MADTIAKGITITFRGDTTEFDKGVSQINKEMKELKSETKLLNKELKLDPTNIDKLTQKFKNLSDQQKLLKEKIDAYKQAMKNLDEGSDEFKKLDKEVRNLQVDLEYTERAMKKLGGNEVSVVLNGLKSKINKIGDSFTNLGKKLAPVSAVATGVLASLGKLAYDTVVMADDINTLSKQTGLSTDTLQAFGQMANLIDVDLNTLSKSAIYLTKNLENKTAIETYKKLGIQIKDTNGKYRDTEDILIDTLTALQNVDDEMERSLLASQLFGKSYSNLGAILNDSSVDLKNITELVRENGSVLSGEQLDALNGVNDTIDTLKMKLSGTGTKLIAELSEPMADITDKVSELADKVFEFVNSLSTEQKEQIIEVIGVIALISPILLALGGAISGVATIVGVLSNAISFLWALFTNNPVGLVVALVVALALAMKDAYDNCEWLHDDLNKLAEGMKTVIGDAIQWVTDKVNSLIDALKTAWEWLKTVGSNAKSGLSSYSQSVANYDYGSAGFGNTGAYMSGGYGALQLTTTINVNNNGNALSQGQAQLFGKQIVDYVNEKLGRRI